MEETAGSVYRFPTVYLSQVNFNERVKKTPFG